jgi:hypothetical protein
MNFPQEQAENLGICILLTVCAVTCGWAPNCNCSRANREPTTHPAAAEPGTDTETDDERFGTIP